MTIAEKTGKIERVCISEVTVDTIDKVRHRTAYFTSTDGRKHKISQPLNLVAGANVCLKYDTVYHW